jgi:phosphoribosylamine-glycine ligase
VQNEYSINLVSKNGDFLSLLHRMSKAGHDVKAYVEGNTKMYDGMINKVHDINELDMKEGDLVLFDMVGGGKGADILKKKRVNVVGGGELNDKLELDREFGMRFMSKYSCTPPPSIFTDSIEEAKAVVQESGKRYVFKPNGNLTTDLTYVSYDAEDMLGMLDYFEDKVPPDCKFVLQEFVEGVEMSTEMWFNGEHFLHPANSTFEEKKFMSGDLGPNTGCAGNVVWFWDYERSDIIYRAMFMGMEEELREARYVGPIDINAIWTDRGPRGLEYTARFGYDAIQCLSRLIEMDLGEFLYFLPKLEEIPVRGEELAMSVRVSIPPYPNDGEVPEIPINVDGVKADNLYLSDVYKKDGKLYCAGVDGYVCTVAHHGKRLSRVSSFIYDALDTLRIPGMQYRDDIGERYSKNRAKVEEIVDTILLDKIREM